MKLPQGDRFPNYGNENRSLVTPTSHNKAGDDASHSKYMMMEIGTD
jgi:hypothetical protein